MKIRYIGSDDPTEDTTTIAFGEVFEQGEWRELTPEIASLRGNPMFEVADPLDHDGNGEKGGSTAPHADLSELRKEYTEVVGKRPFPGWDEATLRAKMAQ